MVVFSGEIGPAASPGLKALSDWLHRSPRVVGRFAALVLGHFKAEAFRVSSASLMRNLQLLT